jgi:hypothetical protein
MSMQSMQNILWRGATDSAFLRGVLDNPREVLRRFDLTPGEVDALADAAPRSLVDLAETVEAWWRGEPVFTPARELALAG